LRKRDYPNPGLPKNKLLLNESKKSFSCRFSGKSLARLKALLEEQQKDKKLSVYCVENCGMADERIRLGAEALEENGSYLTTLIVKDEGEVV